MMAPSQLQHLHQLATRYGVQIAYYDVTRRRRQASHESLLAVLRALGAPVLTPRDAASAIREHTQSLWRRGVEPVVVAWEGGPVQFEVRLPDDQPTRLLNCHLTPATGEVQRWSLDFSPSSPTQRAEVEGQGYVSMRVSVPVTLPWGYHRLTLEVPGRALDVLIISAPLIAYRPPDAPRRKRWGVFLPLHALHSARSWGGGNFSDLRALLEWTAALGGSVVATLPLLPAFLDKSFDPSPYAPVSRLFWNELFIDIAQVPELERCVPAQVHLESLDVRRRLDALRSSPLVDYRGLMAVKRQILEELARSLCANPSERFTAFRRFIDAHPSVEDYARFRAVCEKHRTPWSRWPHPLRAGVVQPGEYDEQAEQYHLYAQWLAHEQLGAVSDQARRTGQGLYLDLPLGVHPDGYDVWRERHAFVPDVNGGAPPDVVFSRGQNWGFPPLHPARIREQGYRYPIAYLTHHLKHAGLLRIDHVMGLHRLFLIPKGMEPREGVYVRYPSEELYAILSLESHRYRSSIVGENLGTVPRYVEPAMVRHNIHRMYVLQYELAPVLSKPLRAVSHDSVASLNTHDMPPFVAFWQGLDIEDRVALGLLDAEKALAERAARETMHAALAGFLRHHGLPTNGSRDLHDLLRACLSFLGASPARLVLVNLEDLWLETAPQNVPGTGQERPNWKRKARHGLEAFSQMPHVVGLLKDLNHVRAFTP